MKSKISPLLLWIILCILVTIYLFQPGYVDNDAVNQFMQAKSGLYSDWHPPIMSWVWGQINRLIPGPMGMFLFQVVLFWAGLGMFIKFLSPNSASGSLYLLIGFYPPAFMLLSTMVKDVSMASALIFGFSLILLSGKSRSIKLFIPGVIFLGYGMLIRHNAILAVLPLFLYSGFVFAEIYSLKTGRPLSFWKNIISGFALFAIIFVIGNLADNLITKTKTYPFQQIMLHDLAGISRQTKTYVIPEYMAFSQQPTLRDLGHIYQVRSMKNLYWPDFTNIHFKILEDPALVRDLSNTWASEVVDHPRAYLNHRLNVFVGVLNLKTGRVCAPYYYEETIYKPRGHYQSEGNYFSVNPSTNLLFTWMEPLRTSFIYLNWIYVLFPLLLFAASLFVVLKTRPNRQSYAALALTLSASGTLYGLGYVFVATACDFRMVYWNVIVMLMLSILFIQAWNERKQ